MDEKEKCPCCGSENISTEISKAYNDMLFEAFAKHGYSREWVLENLSTGRITAVTAGTNVTRWCVNYETLFDVIQVPTSYPNPELGVYEYIWKTEYQVVHYFKEDTRTE